VRRAFGPAEILGADLALVVALTEPHERAGVIGA